MAHRWDWHHGHHRHHGQHVTPTPTPEPTPDPTAPDFATLGGTFNDATRALVGGLWQTAVEEGGQGTGSVFRYVNDLQTVQSGIQAEIQAGQFTGDTLTNAQTILSDISTAISAAQASVNGGADFGSVAAAGTALRNSHLDVINIVANDPTLSALATNDGATGFMQVPQTLNGVAPQDAPHANLAEIGAIFNDAANQILGGVNADNKNAITNDVQTVITDMNQLIADNPNDFTGLTGVHADTVIRQLELQLKFINDAATNPVAGRASSDNILDIIDIVQGDNNLAQMANQGGVAGFAPFPDALNGAPKYIDNQAQTNFWANFIADSNSFGQQATQLVGSENQDAINALLDQLNTFENNATTFDAVQGGIFEARFDNELLGPTSTLGAEVAAMVKGLQNGDANLVAAAAEEMHANAADVGGNNIPITGGTYNPDGLTYPEVLPQATPAPAFEALGATFNDATRALVGGLWQTAVEEGGQGTGSVHKYISDLQTVQSGIQAEIQAGQFTGDTLANAQTILADISTAVNAATSAVNGGGNFGGVAAAEAALHNSHLDILNIVANDPALSALATNDGATGFMQAPQTLNGVSPQDAPHANLAEIGAIFNDAANQILGGVNADNKDAITNDVQTVITDMNQLIADNPNDFTGLTGVHADTVIRQLQLQLQFINDAATNPVDGRANSDNILDIIDIVQGDNNLAQMAHQGGVAGFAPFPDALNGAPKYMDNQAQTNFWANFIADSNSLGQQATQLVGSSDQAAVNALIDQLHTFEANASEFDTSQANTIFAARFDNELVGQNSTLGAEVTAMVKGLQNSDANLVAAAAEEMHANAADVGGNNIPITGGTYNPAGLTVSEVLPQASSPVATNQGNTNSTPATSTNSEQATSSAPPTNAADVVAVASCTHNDHSMELAHIHVPDHHFAHMWG